MGSHRLPFLLMGISLWIFSACGTSESVLVVEQEPVTVPAAATAAEAEPEERFIEITIGLTEPVTHLDPLFAESLSVKRVIPLLYAGLVTLDPRSEEHTSELQSRGHLVCRLLLEKKKQTRHR